MSRKYLDIFCREAHEQLALLQSGLLALEKRPGDRGMLHELLRHAHTLKGSARMVGLGDIAAITHRMEERLKEMEGGTHPVDAPGIDLLLKGADAVGLLTAALVKGEPPPLDADAFVADFDKGELPAPAPADPVPTIPDPADTVRARVSTLDILVNLVGELIINRKRFETKTDTLRDLLPELPAECRPRLKEFHRELEDDVLYLDYLIQELHGKAMGLRMLPLKSITDGFERLVRDLSRDQGKEVRLELVGGTIEMDRVLLEALKPAFIHLVTNAVCHGIESPEERSAGGKPSCGTVRIAAQHEGSSVLVCIRDDGRGMDPERIREAAVARGIINGADAERLSDDEALYLTLRPGFSTSETVTAVAGRGVGLDVVKQNVDRVKGNIILKSAVGSYSEILLQLPLTLSVVDALLVAAAGEIYAIPTSYVQEIVKLRVDEIESAAGKDTIRLNDAPMPICSLAGALGLPEAVPSPRHLSAVVLKLCDQRLAVTVERQLGNSEVVVKRLGAQFQGVRFVFGATIMGDGNPALILDVPDLFDGGAAAPALRRPELSLPAAKKVLVVDDSITTRTMEQSILSARGYDVTVSVCGEEALERALAGAFDLIISDIEMPGMNGFQLTRALRDREKTREIPVIVVSSLSRDQDKREALEAGAQAYIVKGSFDQGVLLETVEMLIG
ncbi:hybrid sensor histidine kinase/response regulator [Geomonas sp. Red875]|uniref:Chemotaxis protein CheA n=1 Tax=Geomesophilobacter sediminis TaxID=2798584 RepID=A0A8J7JHP1_9BACT|nr:hybrid sensor histidine kinase/response regulator [Geomesophilobacter sediminis]